MDTWLCSQLTCMADGKQVGQVHITEIPSREVFDAWAAWLEKEFARFRPVHMMDQRLHGSHAWRTPESVDVIIGRLHELPVSMFWREPHQGFGAFAPYPSLLKDVYEKKNIFIAYAFERGDCVRFLDDSMCERYGIVSHPDGFVVTDVWPVSTRSCVCGHPLELEDLHNDAEGCQTPQSRIRHFQYLTIGMKPHIPLRDKEGKSVLRIPASQFVRVELEPPSWLPK